MRDIQSAHLWSPKTHLKKHTWKRNINIRDINQMQTRMHLTLSSLSNFKEMALQMLANSSMLIQRQPTHHIPNTDETPSIWWKIPLFVEKIFTKIENQCTKMNIEITIVVQCIKKILLCLCRQLMEISCNNTNYVVLNHRFTTTQILRICRKYE